MNDLRNYAADEVLRDGGSIHVRAIRPDDKQRLLDHFNLLSPRSVHFRFFGAKRRLTEDELARFTEMDFVRNAALVATLGSDADERIIGVGRYMSTADHRAEVAFAVADEYQGRGIGTVLLEHLAVLARLNGIGEFEADVLGENNQMLKVFRKSGFVAKRSIDSGVVHVSFPTEETDELLAASLDRDILASAESVRHFLQPQSIAVVGSTARPESTAAAVLANLRRRGFAGPVYVVDAAAAPSAGAHASVQAIGQPVELAVIGVDAEQVPATVADCAHAGVRALVVLSAGFGELTEEGGAAEKELASLVRRSGLRLVGPNCLGVVNTDPNVRLYATFAGGNPPEGNVAMLVQSSGLSAAMLDYAEAHGLGLSSFVSVGNKADVSGNDLLSYWMHEPRTKVIALYLESFGNPRRFARIAPRVARSKPIVALKSGRSRAGVNAERLGGGSDAVVDALFQQAGVIRTDTIEKLFDVLALLSSQSIPAGPRVGVVSNSGGPGMLVADAIEAGSLQLASLDPGSTAALSRALARGSAKSFANPVDLEANATPGEYEEALRIVGADTCVDALVAIHIPSLGTSDEMIAAAIARAAGEVPPEKPVLTVFISPRGTPQTLHSGPRGRLPAYAFPENAALALAAAERYGRWQRRPVGRVFDLDRTAVSTIRAVVERVRGEAGPSTWLESRDFATILRAAGIRYAESTQAAPEEAADIADTIGYPLVVKAVAPGLRHRSEMGCVLLGLESKEAVASAVADLRRRVRSLGLTLEKVQLQREHPGGIEAIVDVVTDPLFGPLLACGLGGVLVEVVRDRAVRLPPVSDADAAEMLAGLRSARLLQGYRGVGPGDGAALEDILVRVSALIDVVPEMSEMRLNPIKVLPPGMGAVVVDGHLRL